MAEKIVSPGVFTKEIDQSFLPAAIGEIGAAIVGPTVKGTFKVPIVVNSYSEYQAKFGDTFKSGSSYYQFLTSHTAREYLKNGPSLLVTRVPGAADFGPASASVHQSASVSNGGVNEQSDFAQNAMENSANSSFDIFTLSDGYIMNSSCSKTDGSTIVTEVAGGDNLLTSGSKDNLRWEISEHNLTKGTFTLLIRQGNDTNKKKQILETWSNVSLDPNQTNYLAKVIGDQSVSINTSDASDPFLKVTGDYPNKSKYVRVTVNKTTPDFFDENGNVRLNEHTASIPAIQSGSFTGGVGGSYGSYHGDYNHPMNFYENISNTNTQGIALGTAAIKQHYTDVLNLLNNQDEYDFNLLLLPGIISGDGNHTSVATKAIDICEDRGDCFYIMDPVDHDSTISQTTTEAETRNTSYSAVYWPWIKVPDLELGSNRWMPPSVVMGGIYAFNDKVAHPWFAPAGLNRGGLDTVVQAERKLTHANRDTLYDSNVNPIASFPGQGVTAWGQKTLQKKPSALDRINVRRLLIKLKKFIASSSRFLLFEQNNVQTRNKFLNIVNPFLESVQANSGLTAFRVVMDETNNTPDIVDRNIMYGQIFVQPTKTAEFIVLDFTIQPTGATFPE